PEWRAGGWHAIPGGLQPHGGDELLSGSCAESGYRDQLLRVSSTERPDRDELEYWRVRASVCNRWDALPSAITPLSDGCGRRSRRGCPPLQLCWRQAPEERHLPVQRLFVLSQRPAAA